MRKFWYFCAEREQIRQRRKAGAAPPWTDDPRLSRHWFPNIHRFDDPTSLWLYENVIVKINDPEHLILAVIIFRLFGSRKAGETMLPMMLESGYDEAEFLRLVGPLVRPFNTRLARHLRARDLDDATAIMDRLTALGARYPFFRDASLREATGMLSSIHRIGPELAYEMVCDLRHTRVLCLAPDNRTWALPGYAATAAVGSLLSLDLLNTRQADRATVIHFMHKVLNESPDTSWEMAEAQRALSMYHFWVRESHPPRRYRCN